MPRVLGAVPYLNARPLVAGIGEAFEVREAPPAELAERFGRGEFEAALLPIVDAFRIPEARVVPGVAIGSRGPVMSVQVFLERPWEEARSVARDPASRTSNALFDVLCARRWRRGLPHPEPGQRPDGRLLIGDAALREFAAGRPAVDLGAEWTAWTGLPFVFAAWATLDPRPGLAAALGEAARAGLARRDGIARSEAARLGLDPGLCVRYLRESIRFGLGPDERRGAELFWERAAELGLAPPARPLPLLA